MNFSKMSYKEIKNFVDSIHIEESISYVPLFLKDDRKTIRQLAKYIQNSYNKMIEERKRVSQMMSYEKKLYNQGYNHIAGIDEVGRGPLAGPVVAAAVVLPQNLHLNYINDSKKLTAKKREELYNLIKEVAIDIGIGIIDNTIIDKINILNATKLAMKEAVKSLVKKPDFLLIDAINLTDININQKSIIKGDGKSISIAASSIVAKVTRDRLVEKYSSSYPEYGFEKHKGYGTKEHYEAIKRHGITKVHRKTFLKSIIGD